MEKAEPHNLNSRDCGAISFGLLSGAYQLFLNTQRNLYGVTLTV